MVSNGKFQLNDLVATIAGKIRGIFAWPIMCLGITSGDVPTPLNVATDGTLAVSASSAPVTAVTDRSGTIAVDATAQDVAAANAARRYFFFQNNSAVDMWLNWGVTAVASQPSIKVAAGASYENPPHFCPVGRISVICATATSTFTAKEA